MYFVECVTMSIQRRICLFQPKETRLISESAGLFQAKYVAKVLLDGALVSIQPVESRNNRNDLLVSTKCSVEGS